MNNTIYRSKQNLPFTKIKNINVRIKDICSINKTKYPGYSSPQLIKTKKSVYSRHQSFSKEVSSFPLRSFKNIVKSHIINSFRLNQFKPINSKRITKNIHSINSNTYKRLVGDNDRIRNYCQTPTPRCVNRDEQNSNKETINSIYKDDYNTIINKNITSNIKVNVIKIGNNRLSHSNTKRINTTRELKLKNTNNDVLNSPISNDNNIKERNEIIVPICYRNGESNINMRVFRNINNKKRIINYFNPIQKQNAINYNGEDNIVLSQTIDNENINNIVSSLNQKSPKDNNNNTTNNDKFKTTKHSNSTKKQKILKSLPSIQPKPQKETKYTYCVHPGNNSKLIITCMQTRPKWELCETEYHSNANLYWTPISANIKFLRQENINCQYINHIENHYELSNKMNLFLNLLNYCETNNIDLFSFFPLTIIFPLSDQSFLKQLHKFTAFYKEYPKQQINSNTYNYYFPIKFNIKLGSIQQMTLPSTHYAGNNTYLIKPINFNRGRYIKVFDDIESITKELLKLHQFKSLSNSNDDDSQKCVQQSKGGGHTKFIIVQKYIERPLTYKRRKFDIRIWVLITFDEDVYVFREGHLKASSSNYDVSSRDPFVHLTNYSVQKYNTNFSKEEIGNEISFEEFQKDLNRNSQCVSFKKDILPKIYEIITISFQSVKSKLRFYERKKCFEIFGYDFLIDIDFNPFLIEINTNPGLEESSPLIKMLIPRMIDDALRLTIDKEFPRRDKNDKYIEYSPFKVNGYSNYENMWYKLN